MAILATACTSSPGVTAEEARERLHERGQAYTTAGFRDALREAPVEAVRLYLQAGMPPTATVPVDGAEVPAIVVAARHRRPDVVAMLLDAGASPDAPTPSGPLPAVVADQPDLLALLVAHGADLEAPNGQGLRPLHAAVYAGSLENACVTASIRPLVQAGADVQALTTRPDGAPAPGGVTPLMLAAQKGCPDAVHLLLDAGADPARTHPSGRTAADFAAARGHAGVVKMLGQK